MYSQNLRCLSRGSQALRKDNVVPHASPADAFAWQRARQSPSIFQIRGVTFDNRQEVVRKLEHDEELLLCRELDNPHDPNAVAVLTLNNEKVGYVPRELTQHFQGGLYAAKVVSRAQVPNKALYGVRVEVVEQLLPMALGVKYSGPADDEPPSVTDNKE